MSRFLVMSLSLLFFTHPAQADINSANAAFKSGDIRYAIEEFTRLAENGDAKAQAYLGYLYYAGEGVPRDFVKAVEWYRKAAVQGERDAQYNLAVSYAFGEGVAQDLTEAAIWYRRAAEQDHIVSQYSLGISYAYGEGVPQDYTEAARWFRKAAEQGYPAAQVYMGSLHHTGEGVAQDYSEAVRWYRMAADRGNATAQYNLGVLYRAGKGVDKDYEQAKRWLRLAAEQGYIAAQNELASLERSSAASSSVTAQTQIKPAMTETPVTESLTDSSKQTNTAIGNNAVATDTGEEKSTGFFASLGAFFAGNEAASSEALPAETTIAEETRDKSASESLVTESVEEPTLNTIEKVIEENGTNEAVVPVTAALAAGTEIKSEKPSIEMVAAVQDEELELTSSNIPTPIEVEENVINNASLPPAQLLAEKTQVASTEPEVDALVNESPSKTIPTSGEKASTKIVVEENIIDDAILPKKTFEPEPVEIVIEESSVETIAEMQVEEFESTSADTPTPILVEENVIHNASLPPVQPLEADAEVATVEPQIVDESTIETATRTTPASAVKEPAKIVVEENIIDNASIPETIAMAASSEIEAEASSLETSAKQQDESEIGTDIVAPIVIEEKVTGNEALPIQGNVNEQTVNIENTLANDSVSEKVVVDESSNINQTAINKDIDLSKYSIDEGRRALLNKNYEKAVYNFKPLAEAGDAVAQNYLGTMYYTGEGVEQNHSESWRWFSLAAELGNKDAQYSIGNMYLLGEAVEQDNDKAIYWYKKSSEQGHIAARQNLKSLEKLQALNRQNQLKQDDPKQEVTAQVTAAATTNDSETVTVLERSTAVKDSTIEVDDSSSATQSEKVIAGEPDNSGGFFASLFGEDEVAVDLKTADEIQQVSAVEDKTQTINPTATPDIEVESKTGSFPSEQLAMPVEVEEKSMTVAEKQQTVVSKLRQLATQGDNNAQYRLGTLYYSGNEDIAQDYKEAVLWYQRAAQQNNMDAQYSLGNMYLMGEGVEQDDSLAAYWYALAAEQGHMSAQQNLANLNKATQPATVSSKDTVAEETILPVVENEPVTDITVKNDATLLYELGLAHSFGDGVKQDNRAAFNYFLESAKEGYAPAQYKTGIAYAYGEGVRQDFTQAANWYSQAAEQGHMLSQRNLATLYLDGKGLEQDKIKALAWFQVIASSGNAMDIRRRDMLQNDMSQMELARSQELASQIAAQLKNNSSL